MAKYYERKEVFLKALKIYTSGKIFVDYVDDGELFPLEIKLKKLKQSDLQSNFSVVRDELNSLQKESLELLYREFSFKTLGIQKLPVSVMFRDRDSLLSFIKKQEDFTLFVANFQMIVSRYLRLKDMLYAKPFLVLEYHKIWSKLFNVCDFFLANPRPNIYIRELSIQNIDTKFIQKYKKILDTLLTILLHADSINDEVVTLSNYGFEKRYYLKYPLPTVRFRILDSSQTILGLSDLSLNIEEFKSLEPTCRVIYIVENKITTLSFPQLKDSMVIFGSGYGVEVLKDVKWLEKKKIFYWGDIDRDGFSILSQVRGYFKHTLSLMMDKQTLQSFEHFAVSVSSSTFRELKNLNDEEREVFEKLETIRIEQERIDFSYVKKAITNRL